MELIWYPSHSYLAFQVLHLHHAQDPPGAPSNPLFISTGYVVFRHIASCPYQTAETQRIAKIRIQDYRKGMKRERSPSPGPVASSSALPNLDPSLDPDSDQNGSIDYTPLSPAELEAFYNQLARATVSARLPLKWMEDSEAKRAFMMLRPGLVWPSAKDMRKRVKRQREIMAQQQEAVDSIAADSVEADPVMEDSMVDDALVGDLAEDMGGE